MPDEPRDATAEELADEKGLRRFETEAAFHQSNILPLDSAMNQGRFYGLLIRGDQPLAITERIGFLLIAFDSIGTSLGTPVTGPWTVYIPFSVLALLASLRIMWVALRPSAEQEVSEQV